MNYPLISEYIEAIKSAEDNFEELSFLRPVLGDDGLPVFTSGNFAVVFKMKDEQSGKFYALKCFTKEQKGRAEAYCEITKELKYVDTPYLVSVRYLEKELFVETGQTKGTEFPVLLMDWVEGKILDNYLRENLDDKYALEMLAYRFSQLAQWLIPQPFAHGDLKPDNILVREDGSLVLVDYDGMYVPAMKGQKARELGSPDFRHPQRTEDDFDEHIDDFPLISILISLRAIYQWPFLLKKFGADDRLLFSIKDYLDIEESAVIEWCTSFDDSYLSSLIEEFVNNINNKHRITVPQWITIKEPCHDATIHGLDYLSMSELWSSSRNFLMDYLFIYNKNKNLHTLKKEYLEGIKYLNSFLILNEIDYIISGETALYLHGLILHSSVPYDINIRILAGEDNEKRIIDFFHVVSSKYGRDDNEIIGRQSKKYKFFIMSGISVNAFIPNTRRNIKYRVVSLCGCKIKIQRIHDILIEGIIKFLKQAFQIQNITVA